MFLIFVIHSITFLSFIFVMQILGSYGLIKASRFKKAYNLLYIYSIETSELKQMILPY